MLSVDFVMVNGMLWKVILRKWGTCGVNQGAIPWGVVSVKNWKGSHVDFDIKKSSNTNPDFIKGRETIKYHCYACPLGCGGRAYRITDVCNGCGTCRKVCPVDAVTMVVPQSDS